MKNVWAFFDKHFESLIAAPALAAMVILIFCQVLFRYALHKPLAWSEELARFMFVWMVYMGASMCVRKNMIMKVDILETAFRNNPTVLSILAYISVIASLLFCLAMTYGSYSIAYEVTFVRNRLSPALDLPLGIAYMALPLGFGMMSLRYLQELYCKWTDKAGKPQAGVDL